MERSAAGSRQVFYHIAQLWRPDEEPRTNAPLEPHGACFVFVCIFVRFCVLAWNDIVNARGAPGIIYLRPSSMTEHIFGIMCGYAAEEEGRKISEFEQGWG